MVRSFSPARPESSPKGLLLSRREADNWRGIGAGGGIGDASGLLLEAPTGTWSARTREMGWAFDVDGSDITAVGLRLYSFSAGARTINLWEDSSQNLLGSVEITAVVDEWVEGILTEPITLSANTRYVVSNSNPGEPYYRFVPDEMSTEIYRDDLITHVSSRYNSTIGAFPATSLDDTDIYGFCVVLVS